jgi:hypothetical protein
LRALEEKIEIYNLPPTYCSSKWGEWYGHWCLRTSILVDTCWASKCRGL